MANPDRIVSASNVKTYTSKPLLLPVATRHRKSATPFDLSEFQAQLRLIQRNSHQHRNGSPNPIMVALGSLAKEFEILVSKLLILESEVKELKEINARRLRRERLRRERKIRKRRQEGGPKIGADQKVVDIEESTQESSGSEREEEVKEPLNTSQRRCKQCNQPGHNSRTCGRT